MNRIDESNTLDGINNNTYELFFIDEEIKDRTAKNDREFIYSAIQAFTKLDDKSIDYVIENTDMFKRKDIKYEINYHSIKYNFFLLDSCLNESKDELRSEKRLGKCILKSINLAYNYPEECKVIIGYVDYNTDRIMHTIFIECSNKDEYVFDYSMNLIMKKEDYIELFDYKIINEIDGKNIKKDVSFLCRLECMSSKFYLCFRDEIMNDLNKNNKVLKLEE